MTKFKEGSTAQLLQFVAGYFLTYIVFMVASKYFPAKPPIGPGISQMTFLYLSTVGGMLTCLVIVALTRWPQRFMSDRTVTWAGFTFPYEYFFIIPSGFCTGIVIPTTTVMYTLPIKVMTAVVIMRGIVIVIGRAVDALQIHQRILQKRVRWEENVAVLVALAAAGTALVWPPPVKPGVITYPIYHSWLAMGTLALYTCAYAIRLYIMNYYRNKVTRPDNKAFFAIEQAFAVWTVIVVSAFVIAGVIWFGWNDDRLVGYAAGFARPRLDAVVWSIPFGFAAFFSVFLFMFKGRTATFATLANRLTSLVAGTGATLFFWFFFDRTKFPHKGEWIALGLILVAVFFLGLAERRRNRAPA